jgi:hypothetical protein
VRQLWTVTIPRVVLGAVFATAAINYFWEVAFGWPFLPLPVTPRGKAFAGSIIAAGYLWPAMKLINLTASGMLVMNRAPAFALALLAPITVVIVWFQLAFNPLPLALTTTAVVVVCEALLLRAYAPCYIGLFTVPK